MQQLGIMINVKVEHNVTVTRLLPSTKLAGRLKVFCYLYCITMLYMSFIAIFMSLDCFLTLHLSGACYSHFVSSAWTKSQEQRVIWCLGEFLQTAIALPINISPSSLFARNLQQIQSHPLASKYKIGWSLGGFLLLILHNNVIYVLFQLKDKSNYSLRIIFYLNLVFMP